MSEPPSQLAVRSVRTIGSLGRRLVSDTSFLQDVARLSGATGLAQLMTIVVTPLLTRLYSPVDFSQAGLLAALLAMAGVLASLKYGAAIVSADSDYEAVVLLAICAVCSLVVSVLAFIVAYGLVSNSLFGFGMLPATAAFFVPVALLATANCTTIRQWLVRDAKFPQLSSVVVAEGGVRSVTHLGLGACGTGYAGLLGGDVLARCATCAQLLRTAWPSIREHILRLTWQAVFPVMRKYAQFPLACLPSSAINTLGTVLPLPLIIYCYGATAGGTYVLMRRVLGLPSSLLGRNLADVFHQRIAAEAKQNHALRMLDKTTLGLLGLGLVPALMIVLAAPSIMPWLFGPDWQDAGRLASAIAPWILAQFVVSPVSQAMSVFRGYHFKLIYDLFSLTACLTAILGSAGLGLPFLTSMRYLAWFNVAAYGVYYLLLRHVVTRKKAYQA